jgi:hypothetical protein
VAQAFRNFLLSEGAALIARAVPWDGGASAAERVEHGAAMGAPAEHLAHGAVEDHDGHRGGELCQRLVRAAVAMGRR